MGQIYTVELGRATDVAGGAGVAGAALSLDASPDGLASLTEKKANP